MISLIWNQRVCILSLQVVLNRILKWKPFSSKGNVLEYFCPKEGQDFKPSAAPLYPDMGQVLMLFLLSSVTLWRGVTRGGIPSKDSRCSVVALGKSRAISLVGKVGQVSPPHHRFTVNSWAYEAETESWWAIFKPVDAGEALSRWIEWPTCPGMSSRILIRRSWTTSQDMTTSCYLKEVTRIWYPVGRLVFFLYSLPFGCKISQYVYHSTGFMASNFQRPWGVPCLLYIDDRHNGQLQMSLDKGQ